MKQLDLGRRREWSDRENNRLADPRSARGGTRNTAFVRKRSEKQRNLGGKLVEKFPLNFFTSSGLF
jgi:hypothetical protein